MRKVFTLCCSDCDILDTELSFPRERDCWLMKRFVELGYSAAALVILNRVQLYQQVLFLSCVLNASGRDLDVKYIPTTRGPAMVSSQVSEGETYFLGLQTLAGGTASTCPHW
jgi:hypothetical protein